MPFRTILMNPRMGLCSSLLITALAACPATGGAEDAGPAGGPVAGAPDDHCYLGADGGAGPLQAQITHPAACSATVGPDGGSSGPEFGPTNYDSVANDDDCKYQVGFWSTAVREGEEVTFTVSAVKTVDGSALTGAAPYTEIFLSDTHPAPNSDPKTVEAPPGVYTIGPVRFDAAGRWTVRFHFFGQCADLTPDSPHGHVAFFLDVP